MLGLSLCALSIAAAQEGSITSQDIAQSIRNLREKAQKGNADAQAQLGSCYYDGRGVPQDYAQAALWIEKAASAGSVPEQYNLAIMYMTGRGVVQDKQKGIFWLTKASDRGNFTAKAYLGTFYYGGNGVPMDKKKGLSLITQAADAGDAWAQLVVGMHYVNDDEDHPDYKKAFTYLSNAAVQGRHEAQFLLASLYRDGLGVPQDSREALRYWKLAAQGGCMPAEYNLGLLYAKGHLVSKDVCEAYKWLKLAVLHADPKKPEDSKPATTLAFMKTFMTPAQVDEGERRTSEWNSPLHLEKEIDRGMPIHEMVCLNGKSKNEILAMRKASTNEHPELQPIDYRPSQTVFGQIIDGKPWWGMYGMCGAGNGPKSIEGVSKESEFILNPYILIGLQNEHSVIMSKVLDAPIRIVYPRPLSLHCDVTAKKFRIRYDVKSYLNAQVYMSDPRKGILFLNTYNARDMGYNYFSVDIDSSRGIEGTSMGRVVPNIQFLHCGQSCGYPGGCNNQSPDQPDAVVKVNDLPARATIKLWQNHPASPDDAGDATVCIEML